MSNDPEHYWENRGWQYVLHSLDDLCIQIRCLNFSHQPRPSSIKTPEMIELLCISSHNPPGVPRPVCRSLLVHQIRYNITSHEIFERASKGPITFHIQQYPRAKAEAKPYPSSVSAVSHIFLLSIFLLSTKGITLLLIPLITWKLRPKSIQWNRLHLHLRLEMQL